MKAKIKTTDCVVCHEPGGKVYLGAGNWRHARCFPGSVKWINHYPHNPHTPEGDMIYARAISKQMGIGA